MTSCLLTRPRLETVWRWLISLSKSDSLYISHVKDTNKRYDTESCLPSLRWLRGEHKDQCVTVFAKLYESLWMKKESKREWQGMTCGMIMLHFFLTTLCGLCDVSVVVSEIKMGGEAS